MFSLVYYFRVHMKLTMSYYASSKSPLWMINCELFYSGNKKSPLMSYKNEILA